MDRIVTSRQIDARSELQNLHDNSSLTLGDTWYLIST